MEELTVSELFEGIKHCGDDKLIKQYREELDRRWVKYDDYDALSKANENALAISISHVKSLYPPKIINPFYFRLDFNFYLSLVKFQDPIFRTIQPSIKYLNPSLIIITVFVSCLICYRPAISYYLHVLYLPKLLDFLNCRLVWPILS